LITSNPGLVLRVGDDDLLAVCIFGGKSFGGRLVDSFNKVKNTDTTKCRDDEGLPDEGVLPTSGAAMAATRVQQRKPWQT
jgi:hypothetical protein